MGLLMYSLLIAILLVQKHCTVSSSDVYSYPSEVKVQVHKDFVYQLNSTRTIKIVLWGLFSNKDYKLHIVFYNGSLPNHFYKKKVEYFGDWQNGRMWYKLKKVTLGDTGYYGVEVRLDDGSAASYLKTQLIVTVTPTFTVKPNSITTVTEYNDLSITCSATGPPSPTVKWLNVSNAMATVIQWNGSAVLKIPRITRHYNGQRYKCQANNNPNEPPSETTTQLQVNYKPSIDVTSSSTSVESWEGNTIKLRCKWLDGQPAPTWKWYRPNGQPISSSPIDKGSEVTLTTSNGDYGLYKCQATNVAGNAVHSIDVTQLCTTSSKYLPATILPSCTACKQRSTADKEGTIIALGAVLGVSLILNVLAIGYVIWTNKTATTRFAAKMCL